MEFKRKQEEWTAMQQLSGLPTVLMQLKPPQSQPKKKKATPSHLITSTCPTK
jgi:hypothetical protein